MRLYLIITLSFLGCKEELKSTIKPVIKPVLKSSDGPLPVYMPGSPHQSAHLPFDWNVYYSPENPEFWADGDDGVLPRPFLFVAAYPTVENAKNLLKWQKLQWDAIDKVIRTFKKIKKGSLEESYHEELLSLAKKQDQQFQLASSSDLLKDDTNQIDWSKVKIAYIYRSTCPHCKRQKPVIELLKQLGAEVYPFQTDYKTHKPHFENSQPYDQEAKEYLPQLMEYTPFFYIKVGQKDPQYFDQFITFEAFKKIINKMRK